MCSCRRERNALKRNGLTVFKAIGKDAQRQCLGLCLGFAS